MMANLEDPPPGERERIPVDVPMQADLEERMGARIVTYEDGDTIRPGGMCGCCGGGPIAKPDWRHESWYVFRAGICDSDGVYYSMLCEGCLEDIRHDNSKRSETERDQMAQEITELLGDDLDGAQIMMDDLDQ
ncbi:MAG: hypothetical protein IH991_13455 [Planctomycetes bacterium]|nr:hypothetical protein [Planctomycetota bacterium]